MNLFKKLFFGSVSAGSVFLLSGTVLGAVNPASVQVKVFEVRASKNSDCSNPTSIFKAATPTTVDLVSNPTFGSGLILDQTYHCILLHVSDKVTVVPATTEGACVAGKSFTFDTFSDPTSDQSVNPDNGSIITGTPQEDDPWLYFSDSSVAAGTNSCYQPVPINCSCSGPCPLAPFQVLSDQSKTVVVDYDGKLMDVQGGCVLRPPTVTVR